MTTQLRVTAGIGTGGRLALTAALAPAQPRDTWTARFAVSDVALRPFNPVMRKVLEMDVEQGTLALFGDLTTTAGRMRGYVTPRFDQLELLAPGEQVRHPMAEALFSSMLATTDSPIEVDRPVHRGPPLALTLDAAFRANAMDLLQNLILSGCTRRLNTLIGHDAVVGGLDVDFPGGLLAFTDVTLRKTGGTYPLPFLHVARLEVIVDDTLIQPTVATYKTVILHEPHLIFVVGRTADESQRTIDPDWQDKVSALPYPTDRIEIHRGTIEYRDETTKPPARFVLSGLELEATHLARPQGAADTRWASLAAHALVMGGSRLAASLAFTPGSSPLDGELDLTLTPIDLTRLNGLLRSRLGIDVSTGTLGLSARFDTHDGHVTGTLTPALRKIIVLGRDELAITRPVRELFIERRLQRLDGVPVPFNLRIQENLLQELPGALLKAILKASAPG